MSRTLWVVQTVVALAALALLCTSGIFYGIMCRVRAAAESEQQARDEAKCLRQQAARREELRSTIPEGHLVSRGPLLLNTLAQRAYLHDQDMLLAPKEFCLLLWLVQNENTLLASEQLYELV